MKSRTPPPLRAFWRNYRSLAILAAEGHVRLTTTGKQRFCTAAVHEGFAPDGLIPLEALERIARRALDDEKTHDTERLRARIHDSSVPFAERDLLAQLLGLPRPQPEAAATSAVSASVVNLDAWRRLRRAA